jgi:pilus assembly protein CpaE
VAVLTTALVVADEELRQEVRTCFHGLPVRIVLEQPAITKRSAFLESLRRVTPDLVIIDNLQFNDPFKGVARGIKSLSPMPSIMVVHQTGDSDAILRAIRAGANESVFPPVESNLREALDRLCRQRAALEAASRPPGKVVGFLSAKGGCGATSVACHVASTLARIAEQEILLADFDVEAGNVRFLIRGTTPYSILDAARSAHRLDLSYWKGLTWSSQPHLDVIAAPEKPACKEPLDPRPFREVLHFARLQYGWVVADLSRSLSFFTRTLVEELDQLFLVSNVEVLALYQTKQIVHSLFASSYSQHRLHLVLNRAPKQRAITHKEMQNLLGLPVYAKLADRPEIEEACSEGRLVTADSVPGKRYTELAVKMAGEQVATLEARYSIPGLKKLLPEWLKAWLAPEAVVPTKRPIHP